MCKRRDKCCDVRLGSIAPVRYRAMFGQKRKLVHPNSGRLQRAVVISEAAIAI